MINIIFVLIFVIGLIYSIFSGRTSDVINVMLTSPKDAFFIFIDIYALLVFWGGVLEVCKESGLLKKITYFVTKAIHPLFKKIDINDEAMQFISMNFEFVFLDASFGKKLVGVSKEKYIKDSVKTFVCGISVK